MELSPDILARAAKIKLLVMDCDGVLTDGRLYFSETGEELKVFHVRDGQGLVNWHSAGFRSAIISGRDSPVVRLRGEQLGVEYIVQGRNDKQAALREIAGTVGVSFDEIAFIGDDEPDANVFPEVGLAVAVADAHGTAVAAAHLKTKAKGGRGAVRETIDILLQARRD